MSCLRATCNISMESFELKRFPCFTCSFKRIPFHVLDCCLSEPEIHLAIVLLCKMLTFQINWWSHNIQYYRVRWETIFFGTSTVDPMLRVAKTHLQCYQKKAQYICMSKRMRSLSRFNNEQKTKWYGQWPLTYRSRLKCWIDICRVGHTLEDWRIIQMRMHLSYLKMLIDWNLCIFCKPLLAFAHVHALACAQSVCLD